MRPKKDVTCFLVVNRGVFRTFSRLSRLGLITSPLTWWPRKFTIPNGILVNSYCPSGVKKAVLCTSPGATGICQYPLVRSIFDKYFLPFSLQNKSSVVVMGSGSTSRILFNFRKSMYTLLEPSFFFTMTMGDAYSNVDSLTALIANTVSTSFLNSSLMAYSKEYGLPTIGVSSVSWIWC